MRRPAQPRLPGAVALAILLSACATPGGSTGPIDHPSGAYLVLRFESSGGFVPPAFLLTSFPNLTLTGDGLVIVPGIAGRGPRIGMPLSPTRTS